MLLKEYLKDNCENEQLATIIDNLANAAILISKTIKTINKISHSEVNKKSINVDGDLQKPLDIKSDEIIIDYYSNGFKLRNAGNPTYINENGYNAIWMAFAERPEKYTNAR